MLVQVFFLVFFTPFHLLAAQPLCFDFSTKVVKPLHILLGLKDFHESSDSGTLPSGIVWGAVRTTLEQPLTQILNKLYDHNTTKSSRVTDMEVEKMVDPNYLERHQVSFTVNAILFFTVSWKEEWGYALAEGTVKDPKSIVISYQKTSGTSHIEHLCGNMVLQKMNQSKTDIFLYEEAKASQRDAKKTVQGLWGTIRSLKNG